MYIIQWSRCIITWVLPWLFPCSCDKCPLSKKNYRIYSIYRPGRLLNFWLLRVGAISRWALIKFSPFSARVVCLFCNKTVTKQGFCKILWRNVFGEVFYLFNFNVNLIVTQVNKWILWCCLLDVRHRNVGKWFRCPRSMESIRILQFEYGRLLTFSAFRMGAYSKWVLI